MYISIYSLVPVALNGVRQLRGRKAHRPNVVRALRQNLGRGLHQIDGRTKEVWHVHLRGTRR